MFAGEGAPERTNRRFTTWRTPRGRAPVDRVRFHYALRRDRYPPGFYGRTGNSGVSIATLDDMKKLYSGFDLCQPSTSVSMTINGPAPMILAMFMIPRSTSRSTLSEAEGKWSAASGKSQPCTRRTARAVAPSYQGVLPRDTTARAGAAWRQRDQLLEASSMSASARRPAGGARHRAGDILKEDQAQNTCISPRIRPAHDGDVQQYFIDHGYATSTRIHLRLPSRAGEPISQLASRSPTLYHADTIWRAA